MTNSHGLDVDYFSRKMERMLNGADRYTRSEWARECARMAKVADESVLLEAEFVGDLRKAADELRRAAECHHLNHGKADLHEYDEPCKVLARIDKALSKEG
jgi:hypothetical protein